MEDFDYIGFHLDTLKDIEKLIQLCHDYDNKKSRRNVLGLEITDEKLDELNGYIQKLKRFIKQC